MRIGYFFHKSGSYHSRIYLQTYEDALKLVFNYKDIVPKIMITEGDVSIMESKNGNIVFPEFTDYEIKTLAKKFPNAILDLNTDALIEKYNSIIQHFKNKPEQIDKHDKNDIRKLEINLMAVAAKENINLFNHAYKRAETVITAIEEGWENWEC